MQQVRSDGILFQEDVEDIRKLAELGVRPEHGMYKLQVN